MDTGWQCVDWLRFCFIYELALTCERVIDIFGRIHVHPTMQYIE